MLRPTSIIEMAGQQELHYLPLKFGLAPLRKKAMGPGNCEKLNTALLQHKMREFEHGYFEVFGDKDFCTYLHNYLEHHFSSGKKDIVHSLLRKIGNYASCYQNHTVRVRAAEVVIDFAGLLRGKKDKDFYQQVAKVISGWLKREVRPHSAQKTLFDKIQSIVLKMFSLQLWQQSEPIVTAINQITQENCRATQSVKRDIIKLHKGIAQKDAIRCMVKCFHKQRDPGQAAVAKLLVALTPYSSEIMIQSLFSSRKKKNRLALLQMISRGNEGVLPILLEKLSDRQPWYVVRNSMILLGALRDPDLYRFARPFLAHPNESVQKEVVFCIVALGGENVCTRLVDALKRVNDLVKPIIIEQLSSLSRKQKREFEGLSINLG